MDWYSTIEEPVREIVRQLRDNGINTICSCGHEMWVQAELNLDGQLFTLHKALATYLFERGLQANYEIEIHLVVTDGWPRQYFADIKLKDIGIEPLIKEG